MAISSIIIIIISFSLRIQADAIIHLLTFKVTLEVSGGGDNGGSRGLINDITMKPRLISNW